MERHVSSSYKTPNLSGPSMAAIVLDYPESRSVCFSEVGFVLKL